MNATVEIPSPDDWHVHLRDDDMLGAVVKYTATRFRYAMVMPNLVPPITTGDEAANYRSRIMAQVPPGCDEFCPLMTLYCTAGMDLADVRTAIEKGLVKAVKYYPAGATTNSAAGGSRLADHLALFELLAELDARLLVHAESTRSEVDVFDREAAFLDDELLPLSERLPELGITVEHISTKAGIDFVTQHAHVVGSITPHHLARDRSDLLANGLAPDLYCKPVINSPADREALVDAATSGDARFFLGTDSAPHPTTAKYGSRAKAGVFNAAYGLEVVAEVFYQVGSLELLGNFTSVNGAETYGYPVSNSQLRLTRKEVDADVATSMTTRNGDEVVLFGSEEAAHWKIDRIE
ncbi:MAG: dihydroorotase [Acidimicrobiales bacterium]